MFCPNCGRAVDPAKERFCPGCGAALPPNAGSGQTPPPKKPLVLGDLAVTQTMLILASVAGGLLLLSVLLGLVGVRLGLLYVFLPAGFGGIALYLIITAARGSASRERRDLCHLAELIACGGLLLAAACVPTLLGPRSLMPALFALGFVVWCLVELFKTPKEQRTQKDQTYLVAGIILGVLCLVLPGVKIVLYVIELARSVVDSVVNGYAPLFRLFGI